MKRKPHAAGIEGAELDKLVESHIKQKHAEAEAAPSNANVKSAAKSAWKDFERRGPMVLFILLAIGTVLLTVGSALYEEAGEDDQTHYEALGVKRMAKSTEIEVAYAQLVEQKVERLSEDKMNLVEEAYKVLSTPQTRRTYDRTTPATLNELYYKQIEYLTADNYKSKVVEESDVPWLIEVHGASHRPPRPGSIHIPPNWGRLLTKAAKVLQGYVKLGRINVDAESELAQELDLGTHSVLPRVIAVKDGVILPYDGEPRILKVRCVIIELDFAVP